MRGLANLLARSILAASCAIGLVPPHAVDANPAPSPMTPTGDEAVRARADALLALMTLEEKAGQLSQYFYIAPFAPLRRQVEDRIAKGQVGSVLFVSDPAVANRLQHAAIDGSRLHIPLLFGLDVIHGLHTILPVPIGMAASWDPALIERGQALAAAEARAVGVQWTFAPMVDIARDPRWGRIVEGAGEDPYLGSAVAAAQVRGFQGAYLGAPGHVMAGVKHLAGYGASLGGRDYEQADITDADLWNVYLPPFRAAVAAGAGNVMSAYMPLNGVPASGNRWLLTDVLRDHWGFKGFVVSDSGAVRSQVTQGFAADPADAAVRALHAGNDMEMALVGQPAAMEALPQALAAGRITGAELDDAVRRVLVAKIRLGLFEHPYVNEAKVAAVLDAPANRQVARLAAERSAVLLRNEGGLLPLDRHALRSVAVIGPLADSARDLLGSWVVRPGAAVPDTVLAAIRAKAGAGVRVDYSIGVGMPSRLNPSPFAQLEPLLGLPARPAAPTDETAEIARAVGLARAADVAVLVLGEAQEMSGEMASRSSLALPGRQRELLDAVVATGKPVVVVVVSGRPLDVSGAGVRSILEAWYPGSEGGAAIANLLFGDASPAGRLPFTWIASAAHAPSYYDHLLSHDNGNVARRYWNETNAPTYPFGYGLTYGQFRYGNLRVVRPIYGLGEPVDIAVDLTNVGTRPGDEVAQLYLHQRYGTSARPVRELKGFQRVSLRAGETRTLHFTVAPDDLRYWSAVTRDWVADESIFDVWVGGSSAADLAGSFEVRR